MDSLIDVYMIYVTTENTFIWKHQQDSTPQISERFVEMLNHMKQLLATEDQLSNATQWWWQWKSESDDNENLSHNNENLNLMAMKIWISIENFLGWEEEKNEDGEAHGLDSRCSSLKK